MGEDFFNLIRKSSNLAVNSLPYFYLLTSALKPMPRPKSEQSERKIFVLDTSVILFAHNSIMNFAEHDVVIPITVLEELDQFKRATTLRTLRHANLSACWTSLPKTT